MSGLRNGLLGPSMKDWDLDVGLGSGMEVWPQVGGLGPGMSSGSWDRSLDPR